MKFTSHALKRMGMRRFNSALIELALKYGTKVYNGAAKFVFVRKKDIPKDMPSSIAEKIEGLVIIMNPVNDTIITVYKNRNALRDIKKKVKRYDKGGSCRYPRGVFKISELF